MGQSEDLVSRPRAAKTRGRRHRDGLPAARLISTLLTITNDTDDRGDIVHWEGGYEDTFEKTPAGWRFKSRVHVWPEVEWTDRVEDMPPRKLADE
jgi:hypothetical protein